MSAPYLIQDLVTRRARARPDSILVDDGIARVSYGQMDAHTNRLARFLKDSGVRRGDKVAFYMEKSSRSFSALLGVLKADAAYVPLDFASPFKRIRMILRGCGCRMLLCAPEGLDKALELVSELPETRVAVLCDGLDQPALTELEAKAADAGVLLAGELSGYDDSRPDYANIDQDLAYVIYTSGSTGIPKGVMIRHMNVLDYASWTTEHFNVVPEDHLSSHAGLHFDLSVFDVYTALAAGASLHPVPGNVSLFPARFLDFLEQREITVFCSVPSFLTYLAKAGVLKPERLSALRAVTFCGEVMPTATAIAWKEAYPRLKFVNQYGPSETTCASMYYDIDEIPGDPMKPVPIGKAIPNTEVFVLNENGARAGVGETGELFIRGAGNGAGYLNDPEKTAAAFAPNPFVSDYPDLVYATGDLARLRDDGLYDFAGRKDTQIKYMGYRIELGEIENALCSINGVKDAAVVAVEDSATGATVIVGFAAAAGKTPGELKSALGERLPAYMAPKRMVVMPVLPKNRNGKTDRIELGRLAKEGANG